MRLFEAIEYEDGRITNARFSRYRVPRFRDTPEIEVVLLDRKDLPSAGAGEAPIVAIAPAIGNAIFAATGVRICSLPRAPKGIKSQEQPGLKPSVSSAANDFAPQSVGRKGLDPGIDHQSRDPHRVNL